MAIPSTVSPFTACCSLCADSVRAFEQQKLLNSSSASPPQQVSHVDTEEPSARVPELSFEEKVEYIHNLATHYCLACHTEKILDTDNQLVMDALRQSHNSSSRVRPASLQVD